jgi:hypothetical protein
MGDHGRANQRASKEFSHCQAHATGDEREIRNPPFAAGQRKRIVNYNKNRRESKMLKKLKKRESKTYKIKNGNWVGEQSPCLSGDISGISGDIDACEITPEERKKGFNVSELIEKQEGK